MTNELKIIKKEDLFKKYEELEIRENERVLDEKVVENINKCLLSAINKEEFEIDIKFTYRFESSVKILVDKIKESGYEAYYEKEKRNYFEEEFGTYTVHIELYE